MSLPHDLEFLEDVLSSSNEQYKKAEWLLNEFDEDAWEVSFSGKTPKIYDWRVELADGSFLTDKKNSPLLNGLKFWIVSSTGSSGSIGRVKSLSTSLQTQAINFHKVFRLVDYLLLNDDIFKLHKYGLTGLSEDDLKSILYKVALDSSESQFFSWNEKLIQFCRDLLDSTDNSQISEELSKWQSRGIFEVSPDDIDEAKDLGVNEEEIPLMRAALIANRLTHNGDRTKSPSSLRIAKYILKRSVKAKESRKKSPGFLSFSTNAEELYARELDAVNVRTGEKNCNPGTLREFRRILYNLGFLHEIGLPAPAVEDLIDVARTSFDTGNLGRFRTLPSSIVFDAIRRAIEFHFKYGRDVVNAYLRLALFAKLNDCDFIDIPDDVVNGALGPKLKEFGVQSFSLSFLQATNSIADSKGQYFELLRRNIGLHELMLVYLGMVQLVVGALTARRSGELLELKIGSALDSSGDWILFRNRKSTKGLMGFRSLEAKPIEPIGVKMIQEIERFQRVLNRIGLGGYSDDLFCSPGFNRRGGVFGAFVRSPSGPWSYRKHMDLMCDYVQTGLDHAGRRYYIRQHQLRRFFAILFFHSGSFGGLDTLRWMLGHTNVSHVWNYITESVGGDALKGAKSQFVAESLHRNGVEDYKELAALIKSRYGTTDFTLVDTDELEDHVAELLEEGDIEIEPEFFEGPEGESFKVVVKVRESGEFVK